MSDTIAQTEWQYRIVDAFTWTGFSGNPAGVVLDADGLSDVQMQIIAREINLSETVFVLESTDESAAMRLRWFTPEAEVKFCGHATLAALSALCAEGRVEMPGAGEMIEAQVEYGGGTFTAGVEGDQNGGYLFWFDAPDLTLTTPRQPAEPFCALLGITTEALDERLPIKQTATGQIILAMKEYAELLQVTPDHQKLAAFLKKQGAHAVMLTTLQTISPALACQSRFFAPAVGVNEDPVTGSVSGPLAVHLAECGLLPLVDDAAVVQLGQGKVGGRAGVVRVALRRDESGWQARVGGGAVLVAAGVIRAPSDEESRVAGFTN